MNDFQSRVNDMLKPDSNFQVDRPHAMKPEHVDLTAILPSMRGADKVEVDFNGDVIGGSTQVGPTKISW